MKVLVAADGKTLDSRISKRFGKAAWYLVVDLETLNLRASENKGPHTHHEIVRKVAGKGVTTIVTGNIGPGSYDLIASLSIQVALARNMLAREAVERLKKGELKILDAPTLRHSIEERELLRRGQRAQYGRGGKWGKGKRGFGAGTPRGRHHLQQYSGRGH